MILITGGVFQGKEEFALSLMKDGCVVDGAMLTEDNFMRADIITNFHLYIRRLLEEKKDVKSETERIFDIKPELILTVAELGCGIVPIDAFDREYRETVGRICCAAAKRAEAVYRVSCGIATRIK